MGEQGLGKSVAFICFLAYVVGRLGACRHAVPATVAWRQEVDDVPAKVALVIEHIATCALPSLPQSYGYG